MGGKSLYKYVQLILYIPLLHKAKIFFLAFFRWNPQLYCLGRGDFFPENSDTPSHNI
jgi:hypothetical protein